MKITLTRWHIQKPDSSAQVDVREFNDPEIELEFTSSLGDTISVCIVPTPEDWLQNMADNLSETNIPIPVMGVPDDWEELFLTMLFCPDKIVMAFHQIPILPSVLLESYEAHNEANARFITFAAQIIWRS